MSTVSLPVILALVFYVFSWIIPLVMLFIVPVRRKPSSATAWLMLIFLFPFLGLLLYLLLGLPKLSQRRREQQRRLTQGLAKTTAGLQQRPELGAAYNPSLPSCYAPFARLAQTLTGLPVFGGNSVELLPDYTDALNRIAADIDRARKFVHVEYYCFSRSEQTEPVFLAMERAVARGVKVRTLYDQLGSMTFPGFKQMLKRLSEAGIEHHPILPLRFFSNEYTRPDLRNHRKLVIVDGTVGYIGSQNLIQDDYFRKGTMRYLELVARVRGPAVTQLQATFLSDWLTDAGQMLTRERNPELDVLPEPCGEALLQVLPSGSGFEDENNLKLFVDLIAAARKRVVIVNPYFVPEDSLLTALTSAAQRGVSVTLVNSELADQFLEYNAQRSYYEQIMAAGVEIFLYPKPVILHSKFMTIDDAIGVLGSSNMDMRSFNLNLEVSLLCYDKAVTAALCAVQDEYLRCCTRLRLEEFQRRGRLPRFYENLARLTAELQ